MPSLRELLIKVAVKVDQSPIHATEIALDAATKRAGAFEKAIERAGKAVAKMAEQGGFEKLIGLPAARNKSYPAPPRKASADHLLAPDISKFLVPEDKRTQIEKALDGIRAKVSGTFGNIGKDLVKSGEETTALAAKVWTLKNAFAGFAAVIAVREIGAFIGGVVEAGKALFEVHERTHVAVESLQTFGQLAQSAGVDTSVLETAFRKLAKSTRQASKEGSPAGKAFKDLGVTAIDPTTKKFRSLEDLMVDVGSALAGAEDETKALAIATQLLGPAGQALVPAFKNGKAAVQAFLEEAKTNVSINEEEARSLKRVGDEVARGEKKWTALKNRLVIAMLPAIEAITSRFERVSKWLLVVARNTEVFQTMALALAGGGLYKLVGLLALWVSKTGGIKAALGVLSGGLKMVLRFALETVAPLLVIEDFLVFLAGGKSVFGRVFNEIFGEGGASRVRGGILSVFKELKTVLGGLGDAVSGFANSDLFKKEAHVALDLILIVLNSIGAVLASNTDKANAMNEALERNVKRLGAALGFKQGQELPQQDPGITKADGSIDLEAPTGTFFDSIPYGKHFANKYLRGRGLKDGAGKEDYDRNNAANRSTPLPPGPTAPNSSPNPNAANITMNDNRTLSVDVSGSSGDAGSTGRAVAGAVNQSLDVDRRQSLNMLAR